MQTKLIKAWWRIGSFFRYDLPDFLKFLRRIPAYWRECERKYGYEPEVYGFIIQNYEEVLMNLTGGRMSKPTYYAKDVIATVQDYYCDDCGYKEAMEHE